MSDTDKQIIERARQAARECGCDCAPSDWLPLLREDLADRADAS